MVADNTTFFIAFLSLFGGIVLYLWRLEQVVRRLEARVASLRAAQPEPPGPAGPPGPRH